MAQPTVVHDLGRAWALVCRSAWLQTAHMARVNFRSSLAHAVQAVDKTHRLQGLPRSHRRQAALHHNLQVHSADVKTLVTCRTTHRRHGTNVLPNLSNTDPPTTPRKFFQQLSDTTTTRRQL